MKLAHKCRAYAIVLLEMAEEVPELELQLRDIAQNWLTVAALQEQIYARKNHVHESQSLH
jgi:hypothetical protein